MKMAPCKDCNERCAEPNCHTTCQEYIEWRQVKDKVITARRNENKIIEHIIESQERMHKTRRSRPGR